MTGSINSISTSSSASSNKSSTSSLSETTKAKLKELGLDPTDFTSEAEAQAAIAQVQAQQQAQQSASSAGNKSDDTIKTEAKSLASELDVSVSDNDTTDDILLKISSAISNLQEQAGNDENKLAQVQTYQTEYDTISQELSSKQTSQAQLSASMSGMANYNKIYQNL